MVPVHANHEPQCSSCDIYRSDAIQVDIHAKTNGWDWNRAMCTNCSEKIPEHIPKGQHRKYLRLLNVKRELETR